MSVQESSNQIDKIQDRGVPNAVYEGTLTQTAQLSSLSTGYQCILTQDLSFLNLGFQVPEVSAVYQFATGQSVAVMELITTSYLLLYGTRTEQ